VCRQACETVGYGLNILKFLRVISKDSNTTILSDAIEALIGAIFLDGGLENCEEFILRFWDPLLRDQKKVPPKEIKSQVQEWIQSLGKPIPRYQLTETWGPAHAPNFRVEIIVDGYPGVEGIGTTKNAAERQAAKEFLARYK
jgi:ribonuclease-3